MDIATINADLADWRGDSAYRVGARRINPTILAVRSSINTDGSSRREMDIQYDVSYSDGTTDSAVLNTLISGSSSGSCLTPQTGNNLRWFGNRQRAAFTALGRNLIYRNYKLSDGSLTSTQVRREIAFAVKDPAGIATYAIVTGAGPTTNSGTTVIPFSLKLLSPRILRSDTLMAGKRGNFTNWLDTDTFRTCRTAASSAPPAALADCAGQGAGGWSYGYTYTTSASTTLSLLMSADSSFNGYGFGGRYTVALYNDDGWKTVNGHAGKTPVATYTSDLPQLPFSFASMAIGSDMTAKYPAITSMNPTIAGLASLLRGGASGQVDVQWTAPIPPDGSAFRVSELGEYYEGPLSSNPTGTFYPAQRSYISNYPGSSSLRSVAPITAKPATVGSKTSGDLEVWYSNRNGGRIGLVHSYQ